MQKVLLNIFASFILLISVPLQGQEISEMAGFWSGYIDFEDQRTRIEITFSYSDEILDGTIDIPNRGTFTIPIEVVESNVNQLVFQYETGHGPAVFYGSVDASGNVISGDFEESGSVHRFVIEKTDSENGAFADRSESDIMIPIRSGQIGGSLALQDEPSPLVILVSGSGGKERNHNIGGFQVFQQLSLNLFQEGYSTFRYDDPGVGESTGEADLTLREMSEILNDVIDYLKTEYSENITGVILLGHNQGGLVASITAQNSPPDGVILAATPFVTADENIEQQIRKISEVQNVTDEIVQQNLAFQEKIYEVIRKDGEWEPIEDDLENRLRRQIEELPLEHQNALGDMSGFIQSQIDRQLETAKSRWFKSWIEIDPVTLFKQLEVPVLAVFGENDSQVLAQSNFSHADSLSSATDLYMQTEVIPDANHLFQNAETGMPTEYGILKKEFAPGFISEIDQFLDTLTFKAPD